MGASGKKFSVRHYDDTRSSHSTLDLAFKEAAKRLSGWWQAGDIIRGYGAGDTRYYVVVEDSNGEETDAVSLIWES